MIQYPIKGICIAAIGNDGTMYVNDYNISVADKYIIAGNIQQDVMVDMLSANGYITMDDE